MSICGHVFLCGVSVFTYSISMLIRPWSVLAPVTVDVFDNAVVYMWAFMFALLLCTYACDFNTLLQIEKYVMASANAVLKYFSRYSL